MTTPGFGPNPFAEHQDPAQTPSYPTSERGVKRTNVPIICAIAILIALVISGVIIWNDVRSTSQGAQAAGENPATPPVTLSTLTESETQAEDHEEGPDPTEDEDATADGPYPDTSRAQHTTTIEVTRPAKNTPRAQSPSDEADRPSGLSRAGWSGYPAARCQSTEEMVFAAARSEPGTYLVICEGAQATTYRGVWPSGPAYGPARGSGTNFSAAIVDPATGKDTGSVLNISGDTYDIDGDPGDFDVHWSR